jgi:hypothetical protein
MNAQDACQVRSMDGEPIQNAHTGSEQAAAVESPATVSATFALWELPGDFAFSDAQLHGDLAFNHVGTRC